MKFEITEYKTIKTTIEIDAKSIKEARELYAAGYYDEDISNAETKQWNVQYLDHEINTIN